MKQTNIAIALYKYKLFSFSALDRQSSQRSFTWGRRPMEFCWSLTWWLSSFFFYFGCFFDPSYYTSKTVCLCLDWGQCDEMVEFFSKVAHNVPRHSSFYLKYPWQNSLNFTQNLNNFCKTMHCQDLFKIAQSGHTDCGWHSNYPWGKFQLKPSTPICLTLFGQNLCETIVVKIDDLLSVPNCQMNH